MNIVIPEGAEECSPFDKDGDGTVKYARPRMFNSKIDGRPVLKVEWGITGIGFGEMQFFEEDGEIVCDNECSSRETMAKVMAKVMENIKLRDD
jgi:hypothetical protein